MISEGPCDTEDYWKFNFEFIGINYIQIYIKIKNISFKLQ